MMLTTCCWWCALLEVKKINFKGTRATSVLVRNNFKDLVTIEARKGVILAGGAIFTPQLLQISGIGDPILLNKLGVAPVVENPQVGQNFIDRLILNFGTLVAMWQYQTASPWNVSWPHQLEMINISVPHWGVWASEKEPLYIGFAMTSNTTAEITIESEGQWWKKLIVSSVGKVFWNVFLDL